MSAPLRVTVLVSGEGTNLQALIDAAATDALPVEFSAVISNRPGVRALDRAQRHGIPAHCVDHKRFPDRATFDTALAECIDGQPADLIVMAGFMRILGDAFIQRYAGRMLNIHPSLLPAYPGLHTHRRALDAGDAWHGATVHFVTAALDGGPAVIHARTEVRPDDNEQSLAKRVQALEYRIYPLAIRWFADGRLQCKADDAWLDGEPLPPGGVRWKEGME